MREMMPLLDRCCKDCYASQMNQTHVLMVLAEQAKNRRSFDSEHALNLLCRQIANLDQSLPDFTEKFGELMEIGVVLWHFRQQEMNRQQ